LQQVNKKDKDYSEAIRKEMVQVYEKLALLYPYYFESLRLEDQTPEIQERVRKLRKADADRQALYAQWAAGYSDKD
tara:strand:+ start:5407 stop:5634 length:228 start_codon:yes stop_codon:yes gene_type:complete